MQPFVRVGRLLGCVFSAATRPATRPSPTNFPISDKCTVDFRILGQNLRHNTVAEGRRNGVPFKTPPDLTDADSVRRTAAGIVCQLRQTGAEFSARRMCNGPWQAFWVRSGTSFTPRQGRRRVRGIGAVFGSLGTFKFIFH
jgi:hypothetical protein